MNKERFWFWIGVTGSLYLITVGLYHQFTGVIITAENKTVRYLDLLDIFPVEIQGFVLFSIGLILMFVTLISFPNLKNK